MASEPALVSLGSFTVDFERRLLRGDLGEAALSPLSARFLQYLAARPGHTVGRGELIEALWAGNYLVGEQALNRLASETRRAAKSAGSSRLIETVQKSGYRLNGLGPDPDDQPTATNRSFMQKWAIALVAFVIVVVGLNWLIEGLTGLMWVSQMAN